MTLARSFYSTQTTAFDYLQMRAPRELWAAVLAQAVKDAVEGPSPTEFPGKTLNEISKLREEFQAAAQHWIDDEENEPRRFVWVCEQLGLDAFCVRAEIDRRKQ